MTTSTGSHRWHLTDQTLAAYLTGEADPVLAASVETHLLACAGCRDALAAGRGAPARADTERRWAALTEVVDRPRRVPLSRLGLSSTPLLGAWATSVTLLLLVPLASVGFFGLESPSLLMALAPLAPLLAVVVAYRVDTDPAGELALAAPLAGLRVVARRALLVSLTALPLGVAAGLATGLPTAIAVGWVLPGVALAALVLLAGTTRLDPAVAAAALGGTWAVAVGTPSALRDPAADALLDVLTGPTGQLTALMVATAAVLLTLARRERVAYRRSA